MNTEYINKLTQPGRLVLQAPYPWQPSFQKDCEQALESYDQVVVLITELHNESAELCRSVADPRIHYLTCGFVEGSNCVPCMDWFAQTVSNYNLIQLKPASKLQPYQVKPKMFDILLGQQKPHRQFVYDYVNNNQLTEQVSMSYIPEHGTPLGNTDWIWEPGVERDDSIQWTITTVKYRSRYLPLSQVIPVSIYNDTAYTVVCETNFDNYYSFYTEKVAKPILSERLFVAVSGQHYLRNLRKLGFKTFDGVIDEQYDSVEDSQERFQLACEQIKWLCEQRQSEILEQIKPITEHNKKVMLETDWHDNQFTP